MGIHFDKERYKKLAEEYDQWWNRTLGHPMVKVMIKDAYEPDRPKPDVPLLSQANCHLLEYTPEQVIDRIDYELSRCEFLGGAFPRVDMGSFGPGILTGFSGAALKNDSGLVWFQTKPQDISEIHIKYDPHNIWAERIKALYKAGLERWQGSVVMGMPDLGGFQDIIATFVGNEDMIYALYDEPEELHRLQNEVYQAWMEAYDDLAGVLREGNAPGFSNWGGTFSQTPSYILQDDFAYMISPDMFDEYGYPEIEKACKKLDHTIYHLDGVGNLNHLPRLLGCDNLDAIQWVSGEGNPTGLHWKNVYDQIYQAGKGIEVIGTEDDFCAMREFYAGRLFYQTVVDDENNTARELLKEKDCLFGYRVVEKEKGEEVIKKLLQ